MKLSVFKHKNFSISLIALLFNTTAFAGLIDPDAPRPQPEATVMIVPFGNAFVEQSSSISTSGFLGLIGIAADATVGAVSKSSDQEQRKSVESHVAEADYQVVFANKIADGLKKCHMRTTVTNRIPAPQQSNGGAPVSGSKYLASTEYRYLVETRLATVAVQKMLFGTKLCVYGFAKTFKTSDMTPIGTYKGSNGLSNCKQTLDHYSDDDSEKVSEFKRVMDVALSVAATQITDQMCE